MREIHIKGGFFFKEKKKFPFELSALLFKKERRPETFKIFGCQNTFILKCPLDHYFLGWVWKNCLRLKTISKG